jgi:NitT/TauT family transport system permease protein
MNDRLAPAAPIAGIAVFVGAWELFVRAFDVRPFVLLPPSKMVAELANSPRAYLDESWVTAWHAVAGLVLGLTVGVAIGAVLAASRFLEQAATPVLTLVQVTPWVAYIASVVLWLQRGDRPVLFIVMLVSVPAFAFATVSGLRSADPAARELLASVDASRWEMLWRLRLPSAMPSVLTAAKYNTGLALAAAYFTEGGNLANDGLGAIGKRAQSFNNGTVLWTSILCTALLGIIGLSLVTLTERRLLGWHASQRRVPAE